MMHDFPLGQEQTFAIATNRCVTAEDKTMKYFRQNKHSPGIMWDSLGQPRTALG
jgi:hypothetical protein